MGYIVCILITLFAFMVGVRENESMLNCIKFSLICSSGFWVITIYSHYDYVKNWKNKGRG